MTGTRGEVTHGRLPWLPLCLHFAHALAYRLLCCQLAPILHLNIAYQQVLKLFNFSTVRLTNVLFVCFFLLFSSQLLHLFNQLKQEILQSHIMEKSFVLIQELLTAAEKSFNLKKYFWKVTKK